MRTIALWLEFRFNLFLRTMGEGYPNVSRSRSTICSHDDVIKWKHFPRYWSFVRGIHRSLVNSPHKGQWRRVLMFSLICAWTNGWVNNRGAGDLRHHCALWRHCNVNSTPCSQALATGLKMRNISRPWPNRSSSEGSQDISACQISGHYCQAFSIKYGNHTFERFHWVKMPPKWVKSTDRDQNLIRWSGYSSIWYSRPFPYMRSPENARKPLIWPVSLGFFFGLCDLEICHMTMKIWEPKAVGVSYHLIKYQGNRWWNMLAKAGTDR